ncbi:hypothetical protein [Kitasatospora phosalacinea]|uniref:hypothetical protein n=1 Tax=Kitasatospora phosalacinea TaxID=2065 RepID=UPI001FD84CC2|nr:hypothetical protein [Kitasatospora phosalacinea]
MSPDRRPLEPVFSEPAVDLVLPAAERPLPLPAELSPFLEPGGNASTPPPARRLPAAFAPDRPEPALPAFGSRWWAPQAMGRGAHHRGRFFPTRATAPSSDPGLPGAATAPGSHEHACIRCPMLHIDPKMLDRLAEIEADLLVRRERAEAEGWLGEIEGIDLALIFLNGKREEALRLAAKDRVNLAMPARREKTK